MLKLTCPKCNGETKVIDSRATTEWTRRRRQCLGCDHRFTTYEFIREELPPPDYVLEAALQKIRLIIEKQAPYLDRVECGPDDAL